MKTHLPYFAFVVIVQLFAVNISKAQMGKAASATLSAPPPNIVIDGNVKEWGDSLRYYNADNKIGYAIANDKENLYIAVCITNRLQQIRALKAGITFSADTRGKKRNSCSLTFPLNSGQNITGFNLTSLGSVTQQDRDELMHQQATTLKGVKVEGFKDIKNGITTLENTNGIQAAINYDEQGKLVYEASIPLKYFHVDALAKNEWAFNFQINGLTAPVQVKEKVPEILSEKIASGNQGMGNQTTTMGNSNGGGMMGMGGNNMNNMNTAMVSTAPVIKDSSPKVETEEPTLGVLYKPDDFWVKFYLAK
jgi:hypothetical protein